MGISDINAAVVGVGFVGMAHVEALRRLGVNLVGVAGSSPARAAEKARTLGLPRAYESFEALVADPIVDVVHVATPDHVHADQVRAALDAGKHVVCEKPLALTTEDTADLLRRATAAGVVHAVCYNLRFYPLCHQMRAMVAAGAIGDPHLVTGSYLQDWLLLPTDWNWRLEPEKGGTLRAVADIGSHWLDLARFVTGRRIDEVVADLLTTVPVRRHPPGSVETFAEGTRGEDLAEESISSDDFAGLLLRFEGDTRGVVGISQVSAGRKNTLSIEVDGAEASLAWNSEDPDRLWIGHRGRANEILHRDPSLVGTEARDLIAYPGGHVEGYADTFRALFSKVYADVEHGGPSIEAAYPTFADGDDTLRVLEAVQRSAAERRWVHVDRELKEVGT